MLKQITFDIDIQNDGQPVFERRDFSHTFAKGLTAITGPNGTGKSLIPEMVVYALFGSKALRGKAEDYKTLNVTLGASVGGKDISITRSKGTATLVVDGSTSATGTVAVNAEIVRLFGYSLDVFNVANVAKQGEIEKLGAMKPAERKRLVDEVVGINVLEALETYIAGELKSAKAVADALGDKRPLPEEPTLHSSFSREEVEYLLTSLRELSGQKTQLIRASQRDIGERPKEPVAPSLSETLEELQQREDARTSLLGQLTALKSRQAALGLNGGARPAKPVPPEFMADEIVITANLLERSNLAGQMGQKQRQVQELEARRPTKPVIPDIDAAIAADVAYAENAPKIKLRDELRKTKVPHECPACHHKYEESDPRLAELEKLPVVPYPGPSVNITNYQRAVEIDEQTAIWRAEFDALAMRVKELGDPATQLAAINDYRAALDAYGKYAAYDALQVEIGAIAIPDSLASAISAWNTYNLQHAAWTVQDKNWLNAQTEIEDAKIKLASSEFAIDVDARIKQYADERDIHITYETEQRHWTTQVAEIGKANDRIDVAVTEMSEWKKCREAVRILRAKVKGYLLPSLNRAASHLISQMTGGTFSDITVTDEFDITVNGQRLETLSGGGTAVANLALRLALGQVLTNRVFSVVMLDEIDASCDDNRATLMAASVRALTDQGIIGQIVLISHKQGIDADNFIRMEEL